MGGINYASATPNDIRNRVLKESGYKIDVANETAIKEGENGEEIRLDLAGVTIWKIMSIMEETQNNYWFGEEDKTRNEFKAV